MNRIYRVIWNAAHNAPQVVSELASSGGQSSGSVVQGVGLVHRKRPALRALTLAVALAVSMLMMPIVALATTTTTGATGNPGVSASGITAGTGGASLSTSYPNGGGNGGATSTAGSTGGAGGGGFGAGGAGGQGGTGAAGGGGGSGGGPAFLTTSGSSSQLSGYAFVGGAGGQGGNGGSTTTSGDSGGNGGNGGAGGSGVSGTGFTFTNSGTITGGSGGNGGGGNSSGGNGGNGGAGGSGVSGTGFTFTNSGTITGGSGGIGGYNYAGNNTGGSPGTGGVGVISNSDSIIINMGTISGGKADTGAQADAILLSGNNNVLNLEPGSTLNGDVVSNGANSINLEGTSGTGNFSLTGVSGFQTLEETGSATWNVTGTNTNNVGWYLNGGTLSIASSDASELGAYPTNMDGGTLLTTNASGTTISHYIDLESEGGTLNNGGNNDIIDAPIADVGYGAGGITFTGTGTTSLENANTYTGGTTVDAGILNVASSSALGDGALTIASGAITNLDNTSQSITNLNGAGTLNLNGTLTTTNSGTNTFSGSIGDTEGGAGALVIDGTGSLTLSGTNTYTGSTLINGGTLEVGNAAHPLASIGYAPEGQVTQVNRGGTLRGHGTINGVVTNDGTVFPGGTTVGVLTVHGDYTQTATGTLAIAVTPNDTTPGGGYDQLYVKGGATLAGNLAIQVDAGTYTVGESYDIVHATNGVSGSFAQTTYNSAFAAYISPQVTSGANDVTLVLKANPVAFDSGSGVTDSPYIVNQSLFGALSTVLDGSQSLGGTTPHFTDLHEGAWLKGAGDFGQNNGASVTDFGGITGYGKAVSPHMVVGAAFSGLGTTTNTAQQSLNGQSFGFYGYGIYTQGALRVSASVGAGALSQDSQRNLTSTGLIATGSTSGWFTDTGVQAQYLIPLGRTFVMPYGSATYLHTHVNGFSEQGAGFLDLTYGSQTGNLGEFTGGVRTGIDLKDQALTIIPWVELGGTGTAGNRTLTTTEAIGVTNVSAVGQIAPAASFDVGAGITVTRHGPWAARLAYTGEFAGPTHLNSLTLLGRYRF
ncbi:MAG: autotransporter domain-containing protein [Acidiferrobacter sp.]